MNALTESWLWPLCQIVLSLVLVGVLLAAIRRDAKPWLFLLVASLPVILFYAIAPCWRIYSSHGFSHISITYQILNGQFPPMSSLLAGQPELYPWAHTLPVVGIVYLFRLAPSLAFALTNVLYLIGTLAIVYKSAGLLSSSRGAAVFSATLSVFGLSPFIGGPFADLLAGVMGSRILEWRALVAVKYTLTSAMPPGLMFFALFLYACLRIFSGAATKRHHFMFFLSVVGTGYSYPLIFPALLACYGSICVVVVAAKRRAAWPLVGRTLLAVGGGLAALLPYFVLLGRPGSVLSLSEGASDGAGASLLLGPDWRLVVLKITRLTIYVLPLLLVLAWKRRILLDLWREKTTHSLILFATVTTTALLYVFLSVTPPLANEYKFLMLCYFPLGLLGGPVLNAVNSRQGIVCFLLLGAFMMPIISHWTWSLTWRDCDLGVVENARLRYDDEQRHALYEWIGTRTAPDAVFIDSQLDIPVFGRRQLYLGPAKEGLDGWVFLPELVLTSLHHSADLIRERKQIVRRIYSRPDRIPETILADLSRTTDDKEVYVVVRNAHSRGLFSRARAFKKVFENEEAAIYQLE